jgi:hypothetical protein
MYLLDNSALDGIPTTDLLRAGSLAPLCVPEVLFYELLTTRDAIRRARLFRKLAALRGALRFTGSIGQLLRVEDRTGRPSRIVQDAEPLGEWPFMQELQEEGVQIPDRIAPALAEWRQRVQGEVVAFRQRAISLVDMLPELAAISPRTSVEVIRNLQARMGGDSPIVAEVVWELQDDAQRRAGSGPNWLGYRMVQAQLIWTLQRLRDHGRRKGVEQHNNLENTVCDIEYATMASQANCLLTRDDGLARLFQAMGTAGIVKREVD